MVFVADGNATPVANAATVCNVDGWDELDVDVDAVLICKSSPHAKFIRFV